MIRAFLFLLLLSGATPAMAAVEVRDNVPFRQDSGLTKAEYFIATGKYAQALAESAGVIKRQGPNADAYTYLGLSYQRLGDAKKARENYQRALQLAPTHLGANAYLAQMFIDDGDMPKALEQMQVLRAVCGVSACEELVELESALNAARKGVGAPSKPAASPPAPVRGETARETP